MYKEYPKGAGARHSRAARRTLAKGGRFCGCRWRVQS
jgi:hypothetical protein